MNKGITITARQNGSCKPVRFDMECRAQGMIGLEGELELELANQCMELLALKGFHSIRMNIKRPSLVVPEDVREYWL